MMKYTYTLYYMKIPKNYTLLFNTQKYMIQFVWQSNSSIPSWKESNLLASFSIVRSSYKMTTHNTTPYKVEKEPNDVIDAAKIIRLIRDINIINMQYGFILHNIIKLYILVCISMVYMMLMLNSSRAIL